MATFISDKLAAYISSKGTSLKALRVNPIFLFSKAEKPYLVVEWQEADDTTNIAIFHHDPKDEECERRSTSWLMHSFMPTGEKPKSRLNWSAPQMSHVALLFTFAQHLFGLKMEQPGYIGRILRQKSDRSWNS